MRINGVNDVDFAAWTHHGSPRVFIRVGWQKYTASAEEALALANQIVAAAKTLKGRDA